jgi:predicted metal-binding membrane protein
MPAVLRRLGRDRAILLAAIAALTLFGWLELARMGTGTTAPNAATMPGMPMAGVSAASASFGMTLAMWLVMMTAMMAPATGPGAAAYLALARRRHPDRSPWPAAMGFLAGYLAAWLGYAVIGAAAQWALAGTGLLNSMGALASGYFAAGALIVAGSYQLTTPKRACITRCRNPLLQLMSTWRDGMGGALALGLGQGSWCVGCCWALMALLFVVGVMNLAWMAIVAAFILAEKLAPPRWHLDWIAGALLIGAGGWLVLVAAG